MFCKYCGNQLAEGANFCPRCGKIVDMTEIVPETIEEPAAVEVPNEEETALAEQEDTVKKEKDSLGRKIFTFSILGCIFCLVTILGFATQWVALLGLAFSIVACAICRKYLKKFGYTERYATAGRTLGLVGLIVSITFTCLLAYEGISYLISLF